jgi:hypothetical protein
MSSKSVVLNTGNQAIINTETAKIFLRDNRYQKGNYLNNGAYDPLTLVAGTVMGRIATGAGTLGNVVPLFSLAGDGSQFPIGILADDVEIDSGDTKEVTIVDFGDVAEDKVVFYYNNDTLNTVVSSRRLRDHIQAQGIKLIVINEMTQYDNQ